MVQVFGCSSVVVLLLLLLLLVSRIYLFWLHSHNLLADVSTQMNFKTKQVSKKKMNKSKIQLFLDSLSAMTFDLCFVSFHVSLLISRSKFSSTLDKQTKRIDYFIIPLHVCVCDITNIHRCRHIQQHSQNTQTLSRLLVLVFQNYKFVTVYHLIDDN